MVKGGRKAVLRQKAEEIGCTDSQTAYERPRGSGNFRCRAKPGTRPKPAIPRVRRKRYKTKKYYADKIRQYNYEMTGSRRVPPFVIDGKKVHLSKLTKPDIMELWGTIKSHKIQKEGYTFS
jgi:hypothetical protein